MNNLECLNNSNKSFYGKAKYGKEGEKVTLYSYGTKILSVQDGEVTKHWRGQSQTTTRHIKEFLRQFSKMEYDEYKKL